MNMFCFQCEQTAGQKGCTVTGVCGKNADTANLQDSLTNALIELANCGDKNEENTELLIDGLFTTVTNVNFDKTSISDLISKVKNNIRCAGSFDINSVKKCLSRSFD